MPDYPERVRSPQLPDEIRDAAGSVSPGLHPPAIAGTEQAADVVSRAKRYLLGVGHVGQVVVAQDVSVIPCLVDDLERFGRHAPKLIVFQSVCWLPTSTLSRYARRQLLVPMGYAA